MQFGGSKCVVITDLQLMREALVKNGDALSGRSSGLLNTIFSGGKFGIIARLASSELNNNFENFYLSKSKSVFDYSCITVMVHYGSTIVDSPCIRCAILVWVKM